MKASQAIARLQELISRHGDQEVFINEYEIYGFEHKEIDQDNYPKDWNMPDQVFDASTNMN